MDDNGAHTLHTRVQILKPNFAIAVYPLTFLVMVIWQTDFWSTVVDSYNKSESSLR
jgi:hypothetical protein